RDLVYRTDQVADVRVPGVAGEYASVDALNRLLSGSDLVAVSDTSGALMVVARAQTAAQSQPAAQPRRQPAEPAPVDEP
ncbi:STN domain-containing protein, partial [Priestia sp. SIMBA_032]|uniref:STN domain-containing protein n=1 Tax=Priestia sp. SIMBA_032 TaxID=3085775 RepID=UPI00397987B8